MLIDIAVVFGGGLLLGFVVSFFRLRARLPRWVKTLIGTKSAAMIVTQNNTVEFVGLEFRAPGIAVTKDLTHIVIIPPGTTPMYVKKWGELYIAAEISTQYPYKCNCGGITVTVLPATCTQRDPIDPHCLDEFAKVLGQISKTLPVGPISVSLAADWEKLRLSVRSHAADLLVPAITAVATAAQSLAKAKSVVLGVTKPKKGAMESMKQWLLVMSVAVKVVLGIMSIALRGPSFGLIWRLLRKVHRILQ